MAATLSLRARAMALLLLALPGAAYVYNGQELGLPNVDDLRSALLAEAEALADEDVAINRRMGFNGAALIPELP